MNLLPSIIPVVFIVVVYLLSILNWSFWTWLKIIGGTFLFSTFILPYAIAWVINLFTSKGKRFSLTLDQLSPFGLNARNVNFVVALKNVILKGSVDKIGLRTNFRKFFLNIGTASPFVFEVGTFSLGIVPDAQCSEFTGPVPISSPVSSHSPSKKEKRPEMKDSSKRTSYYSSLTSSC